MPFARCHVASLVALAVGAMGCFHAEIGPGEVGIVRTPEGVESRPLAEGTWSIGAYDRVTRYDARSQERPERVEAQASDGARVVLDLSIRFHIVAPEVVDLDRELGVEYYRVLVEPTLRAQARRVIGRFRQGEIGSTQRHETERQIREGVEKAVAGRHVQIEDVLIKSVAFPDLPAGVRPPPPASDDDVEGLLGRRASDPVALLRLQQIGTMPPRLGIIAADHPGGGVVVVSIVSGGAANGRLRSGDVIVSAGDLPVMNVVDLLTVVHAHASSSLRLVVKRGDRSVPVPIDPAP